MTNFSVLLPVYIGDRAEFFERAIRSATIEQTLPPTQLVVVCDGPITPQVHALLAKAQSAAGANLIGKTKLTVIATPENHGLSHALNLGLEACEYDIVARADADDISLPERFAKQIPYIESGYDLVGSALTEFTDNENERGLTRKMPETAAEIRKAARLRDPFNHPTVVYRASKIRECGKYQHVNHMEDYWLFARMISAGVRCINLSDSLVLYRIGAGAYSRRGGITMLRSEFDLQRKLYHLGITSRLDLVKISCCAADTELSPDSCGKSSTAPSGN
ncbi:glycosyltransferase [Arcanobacterium hippocoleae]